MKAIALDEPGVLGFTALRTGDKLKAAHCQPNSSADARIIAAMTDVHVDSLPVASLQERYSISRSVLYERLSALQITTEKRGNKAYVNAQQIELLDSLHSYLQGGGSTAEFLESVGLSATPSDDESALIPAGQSGAIDAQVLAALVGALAERFTPPPTPPVAFTYPLANLEALERAAEHGWLLSTSQLAPLLGLKTLSGKEIQRYGFICTRCGKNGAESAWAVSKEQK